ncbi:assimilatory sulfite reductase (NADPH) flavoprotein subunit [Rummeliibacillus pycnus]|uniref:assimilatory sulfite reductase (NADPH) flavoprotein subunit n=1 Tax=Rummeliibacillus pycnus TaxID=101070 RepID=UPI000C9A399E|nr:assimilatory sulfite reductase (NADPH) flavoprotein subunit [Rummeliibacillus pycnus]
MTLQVSNSPFTEKQVQLLNELLPNLTEQQKIWLNGYLSAPLQVIANATEVQEISIPHQTVTATIIYGSQTGNSQKLAEKLGALLEGQFVDIEVSSMLDFKVKNLKKLDNLIIITSTHGEGEAPDNAIPFYEFLHSKRAPKLPDLHYAVLALGDSSYEWFCKTGADFDRRLKELGAQQLIERVDCDVDYEESAEKWFEALAKTLVPSSINTSQTVIEHTNSSVYSKKFPYQAEIVEKINLNMDGSNKETYHLELSLEDSGIKWQAGDSIGIYPHNHQSVVEELIEVAGFSGDEYVQYKKETLPILDVLKNHLEITVLTKPLIEKLAPYTNGASELLDGKWKEYKEGRYLADLFKDYDFTGTPQELVDVLRPIPARLYSIASSYTANPDEVSLLIGKVSYITHDRKRIGVASGEIAEQLEIGDKVSIFVQDNPNFKLPNPKTPIIMIGAGTGVAPFRSFIEERAEQDAGDSWLFFGEQHFLTDFLYQVEWLRYLEEGILTKMDVAFSRDQEEKIYVQHRLLENAEDVYKWIENGAVVYICGDEKTMAKDVHEALIQIIEQQGNMSREQAEEKLATLQKEKRYQRDVY